MVLIGSSAFAQTRLTPSNLSFGNQAVGIASAPATATFKNSQTLAMTIKSIAIGGGTAPTDFVSGGNCPISPSTLGAGKSCSINVTFIPSALGSRTATLTVTHSASSSPQSVALSGTGVAQVTLSTATLSFGTVAVGNVSAAKSVTLTNRKITALAFSSISPSGDFSIATNTCGASIAAGATCTIGVTFSPAVTGSRAGTLTFNDNASNSPQTVSLSGTGSLPVTVSPSSLTFSSRTVGTTSSAQTVTLTNHLNTTLAVSPVVTSGDFAVASNTCGSNVGAGFTCKVGVTFTPRVIGSRPGTLTIPNSAYGSPTLVSLSGTGNASGLTSLTVTPAGPQIPVGTAQQFIAMGKFSGGGSQDLTASVAWNSSVPAVATISNTSGTQGLATSVAQGASTITATLNSISGSTNLTVAPPALVSIAVNPSNGAVPVGRAMQFHATGNYADNSTKDLTSSATWTSSVVTVAAIGANTGMASAAAPGQTTIQATYSSISSNQAILMVTPGFVATGSLNTAREDHTATLLNNGKVLIAGGFDSTNNATASAELYDPAVGTFAPTGSLNTAREYHTATLLNNGTVLIAGGFDSTNNATASAELYDPAVGTFAPTGSLNTAREYHTATLLNNGTVLIAGGFDSTNNATASAELYDPAVGTFAPTGSLNTAREYHTATLLNNGTVLITGGFNGSVLASAELYDSVVGTFAPTGSVNTAREYHTATLLNNGKVLIAGGFNGSVLASAELFDPTSGTFSPTGSLNTAREYHSTTLLNNGTVLIAGGVSGSVLASAELYDPTAGTISPTGSLNTAREYHTTTFLNNGMVLFAGGSGSANIATSSAEVYEPGTLTPSGLVSISVSPVTPVVPLGATQRFAATGTFSDGTTQTLASVTWSSSSSVVATITDDASNLGAADAVAAGSTTIIACAGSICGTTALTVSSPALVSIAVTPTNGVVPVGLSIQFHAAGTYADSSTQDLTSSVAWSSDAPLVATINLAGLANGVAAGSSNISASLNGVTGSTTLTVNAAPMPPTITSQPVDQSVTAGQAATFSVVASGTPPLSYQWQKSGLAISGATSSSYTTPATTAADNGSTFGVLVSNAAGSTPSSTATLTVQVPPSITTQPASVTVTAGQMATFSVAAAGTSPLSYQWQKTGVAITGATSASYTTPTTTAADNGSTFGVLVSNAAGSTPSNTATLTVQVPPSITTQPANQTVIAGQVATFSVVASGTAPLSYQWQGNGSSINGATSSSYTTPPTTAVDNASTFRVVVSNAVGNATSNTATLTVQVAPSITSQPASVTVTAGQMATFSVTAAGTSPLSYQWQKTGVAITGATSASYTTPATTTSDNGATFLVVVSNVAGSTPSSAATLTVNSDTTPPSVSITAPASGATVSGTISITASASDNVAVSTVQFQVDGNNVGPAETSSPYNFSWDTTSYVNGSHTLSAIATDTSGNNAISSGVNVTVSNQSSGGGIPTTLGWFDVAGQQLQGNCPPNNFGGYGYNFASNCNGVVVAWNGGIADTKRNRLWVWGGGHNDYAGNEIYYFDLNTLKFARADDPSNPTPTCSANYSDGSASSRHTYGGLAYIASADRMFVWGGVPWCPGGGFSQDTWTLNLSQVGSGSPNGWQHMDATLGNGGIHPCAGNGNPQAQYDPNTQLVFVNDSCSTGGFWSYNFSTNSYTHLNTGPSDLTIHTNTVIDPVRKLFLRFGDGVASKISIATGSSYTATALTATACGPIMGNADGLAFDSVLNLVVGWPDFGPTVYLYNPDTDSCTTQTYNTSAPPDSSHTGSAHTSNGTFGRFQYFPAMGVYVLVNDWNIDVHTLRLTAGSSGSGMTISNVAANNVTTNSATVSWTTSAPATSQVMYGTTSSLGSSTTKNTTLSTSHSQTISGLSPSTLYFFSVQSVDGSGNTVTSSGYSFGTTNTTDNTPPTVSMTAPANGASVSGTATVSANASDNVAVASVQFLLDGANLGSAVTVSPYSVSWNTAMTSNGQHSVSATAKDTSGNTATSAAVAVTVSNSNSPPGPLSVSKVNPRYFTTPSGNVVLLAGSHTWENLQDQGTPAPATFNYDSYMNFMKSHGFNFMHMWTWWLPNGGTANEAPIQFTAAPYPWVRTGPGTANDGGLQFDFTQLDPNYFSRLRARIIEAGQNGIYVSIYLFNGYEFQLDVNSHDGNPFENGNNVNGVNCPNTCPTDNSKITSQVWTLEQQYLSQVINAVNDLDNVLYAVSDESPSPGSDTWQASVISYVKSVEASLPKQHPVGMVFQYKGGTDQTLYNSAADWVSPSFGGTGLTPPSDATGQCPTITGNSGAANPSSPNCKVVINDTDHDCGICGSQAWVWQNFTRGNSTLFMDQYLVNAPSSSYPGYNNNPGPPCSNNQCSTVDPQWDSTRNAMGDILTYSKKIDLINMTPQDLLSSSGFCLANPGSQYLVYSGSNSFTLTTVPGTYTFEWFNPSTHSVVQTGSVTVTTSKTFTAPFSGDAVLWLHK